MDADKYQFLALKFDGSETSSTALKTVKQLKKDGSLDYKDAVAAYKNKRGRVKLRQTKEKTGWLGGGTAGLLVGWALGGPIIGTAIGALTGGFTMRGMSNKALKDALEDLEQGESVLFLMVKQADYGKVIDSLPEATGIIYREVLTTEVVIALEKADENYATAKALDEELTAHHDDEDEDGE
jgi:uncharacterized membrane protein